MSIEYVVVLTTLPPDADADAFASALLDARVAACVSILPSIESIYRWRGAIERATERQVFIKTTRERTPELWDRVRALHPYQIPEFLVLPVIDGDEAYLHWIDESTRP